MNIRPPKSSSIQPTYEELKLIVLTRWHEDDLGIQPTYEELKPDKTLAECLEIWLVSSLPMRN